MITNVLDDIDLRQLGERLRELRNKCGMTQESAAKVINAARTTMVAIEKGERRLKATELIKLARTYGISVSDFVRERPVVQPFKVKFRKAYRQNEVQKSQIESEIQEWEKFCQNYLELEEIMNAPLPQNYPREYEVSGMPIERTAEAIALEERQRLGLGDGPIPLLRDTLEQSVGLRIFYLKMPSKYSGVYTYDEKLGGCMAINANHPEERRRWSLAHGYLHFLAHRRKSVVGLIEGQYKKIPESERLAEAFPKYFLMPTSGLLKRFYDMYRESKNFTPTNLFILARYYGVSVEAIANRLEEIELLPSGTWERLHYGGLKVRKVQEELGLEAILPHADTTPVYYQHLAIEALDLGLITEGRFADFLNVDRLEARHIANTLQEYLE
ncbi:MAG: ImmA/IrrE family metallo-endopeptidase [Okeania sp. SIO3B5]|nr:ImmA/IrrE family metallo-endopeptidase [Okeania sp. SIO3B5]